MAENDGLQGRRGATHRIATGKRPLWRWLPTAAAALTGMALTATVLAFASPGRAPPQTDVMPIRIQQAIVPPSATTPGTPPRAEGKPGEGELTDEEAAARQLEAARASLARLAAVVLALDPGAQRVNNSFALTINGIPVNIVTDPVADRMRIFTMVRPENSLGPDLLRRLLQANFDTALDARYALAQGFLWSVYIHPLSPLTQDQIVSALSQTVTLVETFGSTFSSGVFSFGGGDSVGILEDELRKRLEKNPPVIPDDETI